MKTKRVIYEGRVQGVGFRHTVRELAKGYEVCGTVENLTDGSVELHAQGEAAELGEFLREIREDSAVAAYIQNFYETEIPPLVGCRGFTIVR